MNCVARRRQLVSDGLGGVTAIYTDGGADSACSSQLLCTVDIVRQLSPTHHAPNCKVRTDSVLLAVRLHVFEGMHSRRQQVIRLEFAEVLLRPKGPVSSSSEEGKAKKLLRPGAHLVKRAQLNRAGILFMPRLGDATRHVSTPRVDRLPLLLVPDRRVDAQVFARRESEAEKVAVVDAVHFAAGGGRCELSRALSVRV